MAGLGVGRAASVSIAIAVFSACSRAPEAPLIQEEEPFAGLSFLRAADPKAEPQFLHGWHPVEQGSWRWTKRRFSVALQPPRIGRPAQLELAFYIPESSRTALGSITLTPAAGGAALPGKTYTTAGEHVYSQEVGGDVLNRDVVVVRFQLDKVLSPGTADDRELGIVVSSVGLR